MAARVVILDPADHVLLQRIATPEGWDGWITPGGAVEDGETLEEAALRELVEEVGLREVTLGPPVWTRRHVFPWAGITYDQRETYFVARLDRRHEAAPTVSAEVLESEGVLGHRWWSISDLATVETAPRALGDLISVLLTEGPPGEPIQIDV